MPIPIELDELPVSAAQQDHRNLAAPHKERALVHLTQNGRVFDSSGDQTLRIY